LASISITERRIDDVTILELAGRLVLEEGEIPLRDCVDRLVAEGRTRIVLDLKGVTRLDSAGIGMLVCKYLSALRRGGVLKLLHPTARAEELLHVTRLNTVFEIFDSEDEAIRSFRAA
jgi:anti-sigma B factor antagonist